MRKHTASRGDIVIVKVGQSDYVKRVIGIGGDRISLTNGVVFINGAAIKQGPLGKYRFEDKVSDRVREELPDEHGSHEILDDGPSELDNFAGIRVPIGCYFLLGDNRDNSANSRVGKSFGGLGGAIPKADIRGRVVFRSFDSAMRWVGALVH